MRFLRLLRLSGLVLTILGVVFVAAHYRVLLDHTAKVLSLQLSAWTGEQVTIQKIDVHLMNLSVTAKGVRVSSISTPGAEPIALIPSLTVRLGAIPEAGRFQIRSIELEDPEVNLHFADGNLEVFKGLAVSSKTSNRSEEGEDTFRLDVDRVVVHGGAVRAEDKIAGWQTEAEDLDLEMALMGGVPVRFSISNGRAHIVAKGVDEAIEDMTGRVVLSGNSARIRGLMVRWSGGHLRGDGRAVLGKGLQDIVSAHFDLQVGADLGQLSSLLAGAPELSGAAEFEGAVDYAGDWTAAGTVAFSDGRVDVYEFGDGEASVEVSRKGVQVTSGRLTRSRGSIGFTGFLGFDPRLPLQVALAFDRVRLADVFEAVSLKDPWVDMRLRGQVRAEGFLQGPFQLKGNARLLGDGFDVWDESFRTAQPESLVLALQTVHLNSQFSVDDRRVHLETTQLETPGSNLYIDGDIRFDESLSLAFDVVRLDLSDICPLAGIEIGGKGWGKGTIEGPFAGMLFDADLRLFEASFDDYYLGEVAGRFTAPLTSARFLLSHMSARRREGLSEPGVNSPLPRDDTQLDALANTLLGLDDTYYGGELANQDPPVLMLPRGHLTIGDTRVTGALIVVFADPLTIYGDADISADRVEGTTDGRLVDLFRVAGITFPEGAVEGRVYGHATVHGSPEALNGSGRVVMDHCSLYAQPVDHADMKFRMDSGSLLVDEFKAFLGGGRMAAGGSIAANGDVEGKLVVEGVPLEALEVLSSVPLQGRVDADLLFGGSLDEPRIRGSIFATGVAYAGRLLDDTVLTLAMVDDVLDIQGLVLGRYGRLSASVSMSPGLPCSATLELNDIPLDVFLGLDAVPGSSVDSRMTGVVWVSATLTGDALPHVIVQVDGFSLSHSGFSLGLAESTTLELYKNQWKLDSLHLVGDDTDLEISGDILEDNRVSMALDGYFDLFFLDALLPGLFERLEGRMTLMGLGPSSDEGPFLVEGTTRALEFEGVALVSDAAVSTEYFPPTIDQLNAKIVVRDGNVVEIETLDGQVGGGTLAGKGRLVLGDAYYPRFYDLEVKAKDAFVQYLTDLPPGLMDANLAFRGPVGNLLMSGDVYLKRMVYRERYNWEKYLTDFRTYRLEDLEPVVEESPYFAMDIRIHAPGTFFIRNNLGQMQLKGELQVAGDTNVVKLLGEIESVRGTVTILDNTFDLTQAKIEFTGDYWNPKLDIRLQTQIQSYTIYYNVTGTLEDWQLIPGSDSGLSERDINSLIAFGTLADNITEGNEARAVAAPALEFLIGRLGVLEQLQAFTRLDRFTIIPASDEAGNIGARVYGEKELLQDKLFFSGYYDYSVNGSQAFLMDLEWRTFDCCSLILRLDGSDTVGATSVRPGVRLKLKLELE